MATVYYPTQYRNYCLFIDTGKENINSHSQVCGSLNARAERGEKELPKLREELQAPKNEEQVLEDLYVLNLMLDKGLDKQKVADIYPVLSKYNDTKSPNIQTYLAGVYRKTKVPDAFGPLVKMLIQDSINPPKNAHFDPTEEIGGAILDYLA